VAPEYRTDEGVFRTEVSYKEHKIVSSTSGGSLSVESITTGVPLNLFGVRPDRDIHFQQHFYLVFTPYCAESWLSLRYRFQLLEDFFALFLGLYYRLHWPILISKEGVSDAWNTVYFDRVARPAEEINRYAIWIPFREIVKNFGELYSNWQSGYEIYGPGYYLYVSSLPDPHTYAEDRFVNLIWAVECLHRS
jgi:hypothetical protein